LLHTGRFCVAGYPKGSYLTLSLTCPSTTQGNCKILPTHIAK